MQKWKMEGQEEAIVRFDATGWLDAAIEMDYTDKSMSRQGCAITHICLHGTAGGIHAEDVARNVFQNPAYEASAHFIIGQDGHIVQGIPCSLASWANGIITEPRISWPAAKNGNWYTVAIEHCKPSTDNSDTLTAAQQAASFALIAALCDHYGIAKRAGDVHGGIVSHADFDSVNRSRCPGPYPWSALWDYLAAGKGSNVATGIPDGWSDDGTTLKAPNGHVVTEGMRHYILTGKTPWDADNWPVEDEQHNVNPLEMSNPKLGAGNRQRFNMGVLEYTTAKGVFPAYVGPEMIAMEKRIHDLEAQLAKATAGKK